MVKTNNSVYQIVGSLAVVAAVAVLGFAGAARADMLPGVDIHIGANGNTHVEGAKVTAVSGNDVSANTSFGSAVLNWLVKTDANTQFHTKGGAAGIANIAIGDIISFRGALDQSVSGLTVKATSVKDRSRVQVKSHLNGMVTSINSTLGSFAVANGGATTSVQTSSTTSFKKNGNTASFADLFINARVKLIGMFNASTSIFTATSVDIASSTTSWTHSDKVAWRDWMRSKVWLNVGH